MFSAAVGVHKPPVICRDDISRGGNVDFADFCISAVAETYFLPFSVFPPWRKRHFSHFPLVRALGRTKTVKFGIDHTTEKRKIPNGVGA